LQVRTEVLYMIYITKGPIALFAYYLFAET